jgi:thioredoxin 2
MNTVIVSCSSCSKKNRIPANKQHLSPKCGHCKATINMANQGVPVELGDHDFHDFVKHASLPVMVDFFSPTCGPCQTMMPIISAMAREHVTKFIIAKVDTSKNQQIALFFNIRGVPTFMFFKNGGLFDQISGAVSKNILEQKLTHHKEV